MINNSKYKKLSGIKITYIARTTLKLKRQTNNLFYFNCNLRIIFMRLINI